MSNPVSIRLKNTTELTFAFNTADSVKSVTVIANGFLRFLRLTLPDFTTAATATFSITDSFGDEIFTQGGLAKNIQHNIIIDDGVVPLTGTVTFTLTLNAAAGGDAENATAVGYIR